MELVRTIDGIDVDMFQMYLTIRYKYQMNGNIQFFIYIIFT